jgi:glycosyltransferase involved in cell wall biosynthesis
MFPNWQIETLEKIRDPRSLELQIEASPVRSPSTWTEEDHFAVLRKVGFDASNSRQTADDITSSLTQWTGADALSYLTALEFDWARAFRSGFSIEHTPFAYVDVHTHSAILRGLNRSRIEVDSAVLIRQMGVSDSSDALIRSVISRSSTTPVYARSQFTPKRGMIVAQFMFLGEIGQAGKGDSGGLGVFLSSLGSALARTPGIEHVYTMVLKTGQDIHLEGQTEGSHTILPIPVQASGTFGQREMMINDEALESAIQATLDAQCIQPDVFHLRYADHGSLAALRVAQRMGSKVVFTLTADPHRTLANQYSQQCLDEAEMKELDFALQRVYVADQLLEGSDGLVAMPTSDGLDPLKAYFPQFQLDPHVHAKPLKVLSEGIKLTQPQDNGSIAGRELIHSLLPLELYSKPIMLNVGRLHPIKQQHFLVDAWASSGLWNTYNLVLIGGNLENPSQVEAEILAAIDATFDRYPQARQHFCLLPAIDNQQLRDLESALIQYLPHDLPHVYVCSSLKEEFGIAVLEAMDAGFLVIGPERGGLSSYIQHASNGFLMDTSSVGGIGEGLDSVLGKAYFTPEDLQAVAVAGQATVRARFDIEATAQAFADFYQQVLEQ